MSPEEKDKTQEKGKTWPDILHELFGEFFKTKARKILLLVLVLLIVTGLLFLEYHDKISGLGTKDQASAAADRVLTGTIHDDITHAPIPGMAVYTETKKCVTNDLGQYSLSLGSTTAQPGDLITIYTNSTEYGAAENVGPIGNSYHLDFPVHKNAAQQFAVGVVKDQRTGEAIEGIEITADLEGNDLQSKVSRTDNFGHFRIPLDRSQLGNNKFVRLLLTDPAFKYATPADATPENINAFIVIPLQKRTSPTIRFKVSGPTRTIPVRTGDKFTVEARGNMLLGPVIGTSDPDGLRNGAFGWSLVQYSIEKQLNHGCLLYKLDGDAEWQLAGKRVKFTAERDGTLLFQINDNKLSDNKGAYQVDVTKEN